MSSDGDTARMSPAEAVTLGLRVLTELGVVAGLAYWGVVTGDDTAGSLVLGIGAPLVGFGAWGAVDFRSAGRLAEPLRLVQELVISLVAAGALYAAGPRVLGGCLAAISLVYHALVYAFGQRLLRRDGHRIGRARGRDAAAVWGRATTTAARTTTTPARTASGEACHTARARPAAK